MSAYTHRDTGTRVQARQVGEDTAADIARWVDGYVVTEDTPPARCGEPGTDPASWILLAHPRGTVTQAGPGDWVIKWPGGRITFTEDSAFAAGFTPEES